MLLAPRIPCSNRRALPKTKYDRSIASSAEMFARDERARCARLARFPAAKPQETTARPRQHSQAREQVSVAPLTGAALQEGFERATCINMTFRPLALAWTGNVQNADPVVADEFRDQLRGPFGRKF